MRLLAAFDEDHQEMGVTELADRLGLHKATVSLLRNRGFQKPIIIGGGQLSAEVCKYVGADHWTTDAVTGVELCKKLISGQVKKGRD
jgi:methanogenic corrinoid protein MtbC1